MDNSPRAFSVQLETSSAKIRKPERSTTTRARVPAVASKPPEAQRSPPSAEPRQVPMAEVHARIHTRLAEFFVYPRLAQRHGIEGRVILAFQLMHTGEIHNVRVQHSSGHRLLDDAALHSMARVNRMESLVPVLQGHDIEVEIPVTYRLQQG